MISFFSQIYIVYFTHPLGIILTIKYEEATPVSKIRLLFFIFISMFIFLIKRHIPFDIPRPTFPDFFFNGPYTWNPGILTSTQ